MNTRELLDAKSKENDDIINVINELYKKQNILFNEMNDLRLEVLKSDHLLADINFEILYDGSYAKLSVYFDSTPKNLFNLLKVEPHHWHWRSNGIEFYQDDGDFRITVPVDQLVNFIKDYNIKISTNELEEKIQDYTSKIQVLKNTISSINNLNNYPS